jgi:hypothetical protein
MTYAGVRQEPRDMISRLPSFRGGYAFGRIDGLGTARLPHSCFLCDAL